MAALVAAAAPVAAGGCAATQEPALPGAEKGPAAQPAANLPVPRVDHHQHLLSAAAAAVVSNLSAPRSTIMSPVDAAALVGMLDAAGISRAVILSNAYFFDGLIPFGGDRHAQVRAENDWTAAQAARFADRLVAFCSFNPLADYAVPELERCSRRRAFRGLKLHLGTSGVDLTQPEHAAKVRRVFEAANRLRLSILIHLAHSPAYGRRHAQIVIDQLLPAAPNVAVVIAHLWGGAGYVDEALAVFADAVAARDLRARNLYFDLAQVSLVEGRRPANLNRMAERMRQIGMDRLLYGSDGPWGNGLPPRDVWNDFRTKVPLTDAEFHRIAGNVAPYLVRRTRR